MSARPSNQHQEEEEEEEVKVAEGYVRLVSGDGFSFTVAGEYACASSVMRAMLQSSFKESRTRVIRLPHVSGRVLQKVCEYLYYIARFQTHRDAKQKQTDDAGVEAFHVPPDLSIDVFLCAKYLDL